MSTQLGIYNEVLLTLGARRINSLTQMDDQRVVIDDFYSSVVALCLEQSFWKFASRSVQLDYDTGVTPAFGFTYAFAAPDDFVRTYLLSASPTFDPPLLDYQFEAGYWWANASTIYLRYISNDASYGLNLTSWPKSFEAYVVASLVTACRPRFPECPIPIEGLVKQQKNALLLARSKDAMNEPPRFPPTGSWVRARRYGSSNTPPDWGGTTLV